MNIIFWNTYKNTDINEHILQLAIDKEVDIIVLAEYESSGNDLKNELYSKGYDFEEYNIIACKKIKVFYKMDIEISLNNDNSNYASFMVSRDNLQFELFTVHFPSKLYESDDNRQLVAKMLKDDIDLLENVVVVGDFNSNPFEKSMVAASCLSALPTKEYKDRTIQGNKYKVLYNPMWRFFGDFDCIPGTYFYNKSNDINYFWNIFDQVLVSYTFIDTFDNNSIEIIKKIKDIDLIKNKKIDKSVSDHLPIFFSLKED